MNKLTHVSLFSGIGGADLASEVAGFKTVAQVEINEWCRNILHLRFPDAKQYEDVTKVKGEDLLNDADGHITVLSGGFPCQPISVAGTRLGCKDKRWLWNDYHRIIKETRPSWVIIENSTRLLSIPEWGGVQRDLEGEGYQLIPFIISAQSIGAPHIRNRVFIVANTTSESGLQTNKRIESIRETWRTWNSTMRSVGQTTITDSSSIGMEESNSVERVEESKTTTHPCLGSEEIGREDKQQRMHLPDWKTYPPEFCRMDDGVPLRLDKPRLQAIGNAIVPRAVYPIFEAIANIERGRITC